eukprot:3119906-Pleurochrysis_carterae.AAC.1
MGGKHVFDVAQIAQRFGLHDLQSKCWPVLLTNKKPPYNHQLCPHPTILGHTTADTNTHATPPGWDIAAVITEFGR